MKLIQPLSLLALLGLAAPSLGAFLIEIDTDGLDDGVLTYNANFSFGGDTSSASQSSPSTAIGLSGGDSIFGGNGTTVDTYVYTYTPAIDADNFGPGPGSALNSSGELVTDLPSGSGPYAVYATWPQTNNVSGGLTNFTLNDGSSDVLSVAIDQNAGGAGSGHEWIKLGEFDLDPSAAYTLTQESSAATFVSMRAAAVLFQPIPEPASALLVLAGAAGLLAARRR